MKLNGVLCTFFLQMTVMKAVNAILEGGLHVGVVLQGQRIENDNITLRQIGISHDEDLDTLGFTLEPNLLQATSPISRKDPPVLLPCNKQQDLSRLGRFAVAKLVFASLYFFWELLALGTCNNAAVELAALMITLHFQVASSCSGFRIP